MRVGWIGLGRVGSQMALSVLKDGSHEVCGHSRDFDKHEDIRRAGGKLYATVADAVHATDMVCVNVFSEEQVWGALIEDGGMKAMASGAILAIHSTVSPGLVRKLAARRTDVEVIDAGFSGSGADAAAGMLTLMVGGSTGPIEKAQPVFRCYAKSISHVGPQGAGMAVKLLNNLLFAAQTALAAEVLEVAVASGITMADVCSVLQRGSAASFALGGFEGLAEPSVMMGQVRPYMAKDVGLGLDVFPQLALVGEVTRTFLPPG